MRWQNDRPNSACRCTRGSAAGRAADGAAEGGVEVTITDVHFFALSAIAFGLGAYKAFQVERVDLGWAWLGFCFLMVGIWVG